jgi:hypothetical protein
LPERVFSAARLRGYRVLEEAGLGDAVELKILNTVIAGRLWLPFSLIEVAFRNAADRVIREAHASGEDWLIASGREGDVLVALEVTAPPALQRVRYDSSQEDPVADAARMASRQLGRDRISRDDLIAHLMFGFWVNQVPTALAEDPGLAVYDLLAAEQKPPLDDSANLQKTMARLLRLRNRVAHHEPVLFRAKHVFTKSGDPKTGPDLVASLLGALPQFVNDVQLTVETASAMAPMAAKHLVAVQDLVKSDIGPLEAKLVSERLRYREAREARLAAQRTELATRKLSE